MASPCWKKAAAHPAITAAPLAHRKSGLLEDRACLRTAEENQERLGAWCRRFGQGSRIDNGWMAVLRKNPCHVNSRCGLGITRIDDAVGCFSARNIFQCDADIFGLGHFGRD